MLKKLFRGAFNLNSIVRIEYARAYTERQAWALMCKRMAKKDGVSDSSVMGLFDGSRDNYRISIEPETQRTAPEEVRAAQEG
jgi:hypothetical protein